MLTYLLTYFLDTPWTLPGHFLDTSCVPQVGRARRRLHARLAEAAQDPRGEPQDHAHGAPPHRAPSTRCTLGALLSRCAVCGTGGYTYYHIWHRSTRSASAARSGTWRPTSRWRRAISTTRVRTDTRCLSHLLTPSHTSSRLLSPSHAFFLPQVLRIIMTHFLRGDLTPLSPMADTTLTYG